MKYILYIIILFSFCKTSPVIEEKKEQLKKSSIEIKTRLNQAKKNVKKCNDKETELLLIETESHIDTLIENHSQTLESLGDCQYDNEELKTEIDDYDRKKYYWFAGGFFLCLGIGASFRYVVK